MANKKSNSNSFDSYIYGKQPEKEKRRFSLSSKEINTIYFITSLVLIVGLTTGILCMALIPNNTILNSYDGDDYDNRRNIDYRYTYNYDTETGQFTTDTIFVSANGDNSTGGNWDSAYTDLWTALSQASTHASNLTLIHVGLGTWDINQAVPTVNANVILRGYEDNIAKITNTHVSATEIIKFTKNSFSEDVQYVMNGIDAIIGAHCIGYSHTFEDVLFLSNARTESVTQLKVNGSLSYFVTDCIFYGDLTQYYSSAIHCIDVLIGAEFHNTIFNNIYVGLNGDNASSHVFYDTLFKYVNSCMVVDANSPYWDFEETSFVRTTYEINTSVYIHFATDSTYLDFEEMYLTPDGLDGETITGAGAGVWGSWTNITHSTTKWFKIRGFVFCDPSDSSAYYRIDIRVWCPALGAHFTLGEYIIEPLSGSFTQTLPVVSGILCPNAIMSARLQTSDGGSDTVEIFAEIVEY